MKTRYGMSLLVTAAFLLATVFRSSADELNGADFRLHNNTQRLMIAVFVVPVSVEIDDLNDLKSYAIINDEGSWTSIDPFSSVQVNMHGSACHYNIAGAFADGSHSVKRNVDLCSATDFYFYDE